jgi:hypothetical protein
MRVSKHIYTLCFVQEKDYHEEDKNTHVEDGSPESMLEVPLSVEQMGVYLHKHSDTQVRWETKWLRGFRERITYLELYIVNFNSETHSTIQKLWQCQNLIQRQ